MRHPHAFSARAILARSISLVLTLSTAACGASIVVPESAESDAADAARGSRDATAADATTPGDPNVPGGGTTTGGSGNPTEPPMRLACHEVEARVGQRVALHAEGPPRVAYAWTIVVAPTGSTAQIALPDQPHPTFVADTVGEWVFEVAVFDGQRLIDSCRTHLVARM